MRAPFLPLLSGLLLFITGWHPLGAQDLAHQAASLVDSLARIVQVRDAPVSRVGVAVLPLTEVGDLTRQAELGATVRSLVEGALGNSLVFRLIDRDNLASLLAEADLSLSGLMADGQVRQVELGAIDCFIAGTVGEEAEGFRVVLRLIRASSAEVLGTAEQVLPREALISLGETLAWQYVMANGLGLGLYASPGEALMMGFAPTVAAGESDRKHALSFHGDIGYRLSRDFRIALQVGYDDRDVYNDRSRHYLDLIATSMPGLANVTASWDLLDRKTGLVVADYALTSLTNFPVYYTITQRLIAADLIAQWVFNPDPALNLAIGAGPSAGAVIYFQTYDQLPVRVSGNGDPALTMTRKILSRGMPAFGAAASVRGEWFMLPRLALVLGADINWLVPAPIPGDDGWESQTDNEVYYTSDDRSALSFGLNPFMLPDGTVWKDDMFPIGRFKAWLGLSLYF